MGDWDMKKTIVFFSPLALLVLAGIVWLLIRGTILTRFRMSRQLNSDPDIKDYMTIFNWSRKVLYIPTIIASLIAAAVTGKIAVQPTRKSGKIKAEYEN